MLVWLMSKEECKISLYKCPAYAYAFSILVKRFNPELPEKHFFFVFWKKVEIQSLIQVSTQFWIFRFESWM